ncbi:hypothetical protein BGZ49_010787 [Haplosporangium sp. Z 27]|nr:hypothetical protein BGZ49_010787 [Haplosporangium sp. Z 27]
MEHWSFEELRDVKDTLDQIARENRSSIKYDHENFVFAITGKDTKLQRQALIALNDLIEEKRPALPDYPEKPFQDVQDISLSLASKLQEECVSDILIDIADSTSSSSGNDLNSASSHTIEIEVDERVIDPYEMYFPDKKQRVELPIILAEKVQCNATISDDGRKITVSGKNNANVSNCVSQIRQMQEYYLRPRFHLDSVALVYGSSREEFRLQFVPVAQHSYYSRQLEYLPSSFLNMDPKNFCVIEKAVYDPSREVWALRPGIRLAPRLQEPTQRPHHSTTINVGSQQGAGGSRQQGWGRGAPLSNRQATSPSHIPKSNNMEWHEQESPNFGFNPVQERPTNSKQKRQTSWKPINQNFSNPQQSPGQSPWQSSGLPNSLKSQSSSSSSQSRISMREVQPEWSAQPFENKDENDFPSLGQVSKNVSAFKGTSSSSSAPVSSSSSQAANVSKAASAALNASGRADPQHTSLSSESIVFGEQDLAYLENIPARASRPRERDNFGLEQATLRDPAKEREDAQRTIRSLPRLQASPNTSIPRQVTPEATFIIGMRSFNMRRLSESIRNGLKELRGQRKEIRLVGRLGCMLYPTDNFILNQSWEYTHLDTILKDRRIQPVFSPITTTKGVNIENMYGFLGTPKTESAHFEIECETRINPTSRFVPTRVIVPTTIAVLDRVVTPWETFGEVIWSALDKNMDFEILLQAREGTIHDTKSALGRTDVKPFSAFRKRLSIGTHNSHITCHDIRASNDGILLKVCNINFRETLTYEKPGNFTVMVHKIEELKLVRTGGLDIVTAQTSGPGKRWYEFEVHNDDIDKKLQSNISIIPGTVADWTVDEIVGKDPNNSEELVRMVRALMLLVDNCQDKFNQ